MAKRRKSAPSKSEPGGGVLRLLANVRDTYLFVAVILVSIVVRLPFLGTFDVVAYDGTYYISLARSLLRGAPVSGPFPIGYPLVVAPFILFGDDVRMAQLVSMLAAMGTLLVFYVLARRFTSRPHAILGMFALALTPLFIRASLNALSESVYILWLLLGLLAFLRGRDVLFGLLMGAATITRPEAAAIFGLLVLVRIRNIKRAVVPALAFLVVFAVNVAIFSFSAGKLVVLQKSEFFGSSASSWQLREAFIDFEGRDELLRQQAEDAEPRNLFLNYVHRLPGEVLQLGRHVMPVLFLLGIYGIVRRRSVLAFAFVPFFVYPLVTPRSEFRYALPYIPFLFLFALMALDGIKPKLRPIAYVLIGISAVVGFAVNLNMLTTPEDDPIYESVKSAGEQFRSRVRPGDKMADRKPYFAFYAGADYTKLPAAPYDDTINYLAGENVRFLALHQPTTHNLRPALRPLLYDKAWINGELRYTQVYHNQAGMVVYELARPADPLERRVLNTDGSGALTSPCWSPDGKLIAYRLVGAAGEVRVRSPQSGEERVVVTGRPITDAMSWSPDSKRLAYADGPGANLDLFVCDIESGETTRLTTGNANNRSPSWSPRGDEIVFSSDRLRKSDIWSIDLASGDVTQVSTFGGNQFPAVSPDGERIAWVGNAQSLLVFDRVRGTVARSKVPGRASFAPVWSRDGRFIAVGGEVHGGTNVFLVAADLSSGLVLTKGYRGEGMPTWDPEGRRLAVVSNTADGRALTILSGLEPFLDRLISPADIWTFSPHAPVGP